MAVEVCGCKPGVISAIPASAFTVAPKEGMERRLQIIQMTEVYGKAGIVDVLSKLCHCRFLVLVVLFAVKFGNGVLINVEMELSILLQYDMRQNKEQRELV